MVGLKLSAIASLYADVFGADLLRYAVGAGGVHLIINLGFAARLANQKVRACGPVPGQILREVLASLRTVAIFAAVGTDLTLGDRSLVAPLAW